MANATTYTARVLIVEDNDSVRRLVTETLSGAGYHVHEAADGKSAFARLRDAYYDLVLLDLKLGDIDGMEILRTIRRQDETLPVIIVSSLHDLETKVGGFDIGCDDYITKPFQPAELIGRVRRLLRRSGLGEWGTPTARRPVEERVSAGPFELDVRGLRVFKNGKPIEMRKKLFDLFLFFARNPDAIIPKLALHERAWDFRDDLNENTLYVHIHQLRTLIEDDPSHPLYLKTVRGVGFIFSPEGTADGAGTRLASN